MKLISCLNVNIMIECELLLPDQLRNETNNYQNVMIQGPNQKKASG